MKILKKSNLYFLFILVYEIIGSIGLGFLYNNLKITDIRIILLINHLTIFIFPGIIYLIISKRSIKEILRLNKLNLKSLLTVVLISFLVQPIMSFLSLISSFFFNNDVGEMVTQISSTNYFVLLLLIAGLPAISEELTLRGIILSGYDKKNKYVAAIVTGLFFGILHLNPQQFLYTFALGFVLALVVRITNSIFSSVIMHFIINGTSVTVTKINYLVQKLSFADMVQETQEYNMINQPILEKLLLTLYFSVVAIVFRIIVYYLIKKLEKLNSNVKYKKVIREDYNFEIYRKESSILESDQEKILNIPFILSILIFIVYMILFE